MSLLILLFIILIPIIEIVVFFQVGEQIGLWLTLITVIVTVMIGSSLLRYQGLSTLIKVKESMNAGKLPIKELYKSFCLLAAGVFLVTPGFVTDGLGLLLFLPIFRNLIRRFIGKRLNTRETFNSHIRSGFGQEADQNRDPNIIDGEFHEIITESDSKNKVINDKKPLAPPRP